MKHDVHLELKVNHEQEQTKEKNDWILFIIFCTFTLLNEGIDHFDRFNRFILSFSSKNKQFIIKIYWLVHLPIK